MSTTVVENVSESNSVHLTTTRTQVHEQSSQHNGEQVKDARPWVVLGASFAVIFVGVGYTNTFGVFEDYYQSTMFPDRSPSELLLIGSVSSSLYLILGAFAGRFADLLGFQISLAVGSLLMIGGLVSASFATEYYQFLLSQGVMFGLGVAFAYYPAVSIPRQYFGSEKHGFASGVVVSGGALGGCILPYVVRTCIDRHGLPQTFRILAYLAVGLLVPSIPLLRPKMDRHRRGQQTATIQANRKKSLDLSLLRDKRYLTLLAAGTTAMVGFLPRYFFVTTSARAQGVQGTYATWLLGIMNGLSIIGRVGIGTFADRFGKVLALEISFVMCGLGHLIFWLPAVLVSSGSGQQEQQQQGVVTALFTLFVVFIGILGSGFVSLIPVVVSHLFGPQELASKMGLLNSVIGIGVLAGPSAIYSIIAADSWSVGIVVSGGLMIAGGLAMSGMFKYT